MTDRDLTCEERIDADLADTTAEIRRILDAEYSGAEPYSEGWPDDLSSFNEYGLSFDYVRPGTFDGQDEGFYRWQLSWGGPSSEYRFYYDRGGCYPYRIEYVYMDWFDGAVRDVTYDEVAREVLDQLSDFAQGAYNAAWDEVTP